MPRRKERDREPDIAGEGKFPHLIHLVQLSRKEFEPHNPIDMESVNHVKSCNCVRLEFLPTNLTEAG